jgi:methylmalonyl-CoA mutase, C-terminal domain
MELLRGHQADDIVVIVGGIVPEPDVEGLKQAGVAGVFGPGASMDEIVAFIRERAPGRRLSLVK